MANKSNNIINFAQFVCAELAIFVTVKHWTNLEMYDITIKTLDFDGQDVKSGYETTYFDYNRKYTADNKTHFIKQDKCVDRATKFVYDFITKQRTINYADVKKIQNLFK